MKKYLKMIIVMSVIFSGAQYGSAQTQTELQSQLVNLKQQLLVLLQQQLLQITGGVISDAPVVLPIGQSCGFSYSGSESILDIQTALKNQGYTITKIDGKIGPNTRAAVSAFQASVGAEKVDGLIGEETRKLLAQNSVVCIGDSGVTVSDDTAIISEAGVCTFRYNGDSEIASIQQELKNQGYAIEKVDGKIGPNTRAAVSAFQASVGAEKVDGLIGEETRIALARKSVSCNATDGSVNNVEHGDTNLTRPVEPTPIPETITDNPIIPIPIEDTVETFDFIQQTEIIAAVRSTTAGVPDDTGVFTYRLEFNTDTVIYIPTHPEQAFEIGLVDASGVTSSVLGIQSIVASSQKILREDGISYFRVQKGDTMSLRTSIQPGAGTYYAQLNRLSYSNENAAIVLNPAMINYEFDSAIWKSETVSILN